MNIIDLTGQKINEWTVIEYAGNQMWKCKCSCGKIKLIDGQNLRSKTAKSCGHDAREDLTGLLFGSWKVISPAENYSWLCECQCPLHTRRVVLASSLKKGRSKSCGNRTYHPAVRSDNKSKNNETNEVVKIRHWSQESIQNKINKVSPYTVGAIFGTWEIKNKVDNRYYECVCKECGLEKTLTTSGLWNARNNDSKCNHLKTCTSVKVGDVFGRLKVIAIDHSY